MRFLKVATACVTAMVVWTLLVIWLALEGMWMSAVAEQDKAQEFFDWAVSEIETQNLGATALMLIEDGEVAKRYFSEGIDEETLFPTASFSKWVAALAVMSLVEQGKIDLDLPVSSYLKRWQLPDSEFDNEGVTVRRLLSHTAGLTDGLGFGDYEGNETVPALEEALSHPRASSGSSVKIAVGQAPGAEFAYSGGGYLIMELIVEEVSGVAFATYVAREILEPLDMNRSTYEFLGDKVNVAANYQPDGSEAPMFKYASNAATAFASSADDLAKLSLSLLSGVQLPLESKTIKAMREPHGFVLGASIWGLGTMLYAPNTSGDYVFGHDGANDPAINASVRLNPQTLDGIVMLVSGQPTLASNVGSEWVLWQTAKPDFLSTDRALESALAPIVIGFLVILVLSVVWWRRARVA